MSEETDLKPSDIMETITHFRASDALKENAFGFLVSSVRDWKVADGFEFDRLLDEPEQQYMDKYFPDHFIKKDGRTYEAADMGQYEKGDRYCKDNKSRYNKRYFIPGSYWSAKSVIRTALDFGIPLEDSGVPKGKTRLQKEIKARKAETGKGIKTELENCLDAVRKLNKNFPMLSDDDKETVQGSLTCW
jgi:hypothetical protein